MSLRERFRLYPLRSLYFAVFLAVVGTLSLSFLVFQHISTYLERKHFDPVYDRLDELQMDSFQQDIEQRRVRRRWRSIWRSWTASPGRSIIYSMRMASISYQAKTE